MLELGGIININTVIKDDTSKLLKLAVVPFLIQANHLKENAATMTIGQSQRTASFFLKARKPFSWLDKCICSFVINARKCVANLNNLLYGHRNAMLCRSLYTSLLVRHSAKIWTAVRFGKWSDFIWWIVKIVHLFGHCTGLLLLTYAIVYHRYSLISREQYWIWLRRA